MHIGPHSTAEQIVRWALETFGRNFAVVTSFQREGMVIADMALRIRGDARILTIDTGCLPAATHEMIARVEQRYGIAVERLLPDAGEVAAMTRLHGAALFRESVAKRRLCCEVRKVRPLERALPGLAAYAVGLRRSQADTRAGVPKVAESRGLYKLSPLADWTAADVARYLESHGVPEHPLYAQGYSTIGCEPCTRAVAAGEGERDGRWWWESGAEKECGLHFTPQGQALRQVDVLVQELLTTDNYA